MKNYTLLGLTRFRLTIRNVNNLTKELWSISEISSFRLTIRNVNNWSNNNWERWLNCFRLTIRNVNKENWNTVSGCWTVLD